MHSYLSFLHCRINVKILQVTFKLRVGVFQIKQCLKRRKICSEAHKNKHQGEQLADILNIHLGNSFLKF